MKIKPFFIAAALTFVSPAAWSQTGGDSGAGSGETTGTPGTAVPTENPVGTATGNTPSTGAIENNGTTTPSPTPTPTPPND